MKSWLQLVRIANWPSAISNVLAASMLARATLPTETRGTLSILTLPLLVLGSVCLYAAGMILNDWNDQEKDRRERPERPLASGRIHPRRAWLVAMVLLTTALLIAALLAWTHHSWLPLATSFAIVASIFGYDIAFKHHFHSPVWMGLCRGGNVLWGASTAFAFHTLPFFTVAVWQQALSLLIYTAGVTWMAKNETSDRLTWQFWLGFGWTLAGLAMFATLPFQLAGDNGQWVSKYSGFVLFLGLLAFTLARRGFGMLSNPISSRRQQIIVLALRNMILIDAAVCFLAGNGEIWPSLAVALLLPISMVLSKLHRLT